MRLWLSARLRMGLKHRHHLRPGRQADALVADPAQLASAIVAIGLLHRRVGHGIVCTVCIVGLVRLVCRSNRGQCVMAMVRSVSVGGLTDSGFGVVHKTGCHGHPHARPQPQRHEAQQEAKEQSAHGQIISQDPACTALEARQTLSAAGSPRHRPMAAQNRFKTESIKRSETDPPRVGWIRRCATAPSPKR